MLAVSVFTFPGQGLSVDNNMATGTKPASSKSISCSALQRWPPELLENYEFEYDDPNEKAIKAMCIVCNKHYKKFQAQFKGQVVQDIVNYGKNGTTYLLKPNLERHLSREGHRKCKEFETGESTSKNQKTITQAFGGAFELAKKTLCNIMCIVHCASN